MNRVKTSNCLDSIAVFENLIELRFEDLSVDELNFKEVMPSLKNLLIDKASTPMTFRITSYNVCYTKLLRRAQCKLIPP